MEILQESLTVVISISATLGVAWKLLVPHLRGVMAGEVSGIGEEQKLQGAKLEELESRSEKDYAALTKLAEQNRAIMGALLVLLRHAEAGNHTGEIREAQQELEDRIISML
jgi:hypothetical protein